MSVKPVNVGIIGCGAISGAYLRHARSFPVLSIVACADLNPAAAEVRAREFEVPRACSVEQLLADPSVEIVLNLTVPKAHVPVSLAAVEAGKHVYLEKPLGVNRDEGQRLMEAARRKGVRVGCAPDTFLGVGVQTARKAIDDGAIGRPVAFTAYMQGRGHESWHPNPEFYYEPGGGPMLDMGPYYLTALLNLLGPVRRVVGLASIAIPVRTITHRDGQGNPGPKFGKKIEVQTPDHICGVMEFENGCVGTIIQSFATIEGNYDGRFPITINGTEGALRAPDPNKFDDEVVLRRLDSREPQVLPSPFVAGYGRAVGLADLAYAIRSGRPARCSGEQAMAVLDLMQAFLDSSSSGREVRPSVPYARPAPMPSTLPFGTLDE